MAKKTDGKPRVLTPQEQEAERIRKVPREKRTAEQSARLSVLVGEMKRDRFNRIFPRRIEGLKKAIRNVVRMGSVLTYQYTEEEAEAICAAMKRYAAEVEHAFRGAPKEKGIFDL